MHGHEVVAVNTPEQALMMAEELQPQIAVLDVGLPNIDGYQRASHLRSKVSGDCLFVTATGYGRGPDHEQSKAGVAAHFVKPIDINRLLALCHQQTQSRL